MKKSILALGSFMLSLGLAAQTTYFSQDFEGGSMPAGWTGQGSWTVANAATGSSSSFPIPTTSYFAVCNDDASQTAANSNVWLTSPVINLSAASTVYLKFDSYFYGATYQSATETASVQYSTDGGSTWTSAGNISTSTSGWLTSAINLTSQLAGQSNVKIGFKYDDAGGWLYGCCVDNVTLFQPAPFEAALTAITPATASPQSFSTVSSNVTLGGTITNNGSSAITAITVKYNDGTNTYTTNLSSLNIAPFGTYNFTCTQPYTVPSVGTHPISMWIELVSDGDQSNDSMNTVIQGVPFLPTHHVTFEEATGTWCGWCPRGAVYMDSLDATYPATTDLIAVHNGDPMVVTAYDAGVGTLIAGYPSILVNRGIVDDPSNAFAQYSATINDFGYADLVPTVTYNNSTRVCSVAVAATFAANLSGDYRIAVVFTEDNVTGTASTYDQHNYYAGGSYGPMGGYESLPSTVPAAQMHYNFVARDISGGFGGAAGSLPSTITAGNTYNYTYAYTIPAAYNVANMRVHVLLIDNQSATQMILNSAGATIPMGIQDQTGIIAQSSLFPNPSTSTSTLSYSLVEASNVTINIYDAMGALVSSQNEGSRPEGNQNAIINTDNLANGMYMVELVAGDSKATTRMVVSH